MSKRNAELTRIDVAQGTVDHLCIGDWLQLEMMDADKRKIIFDLHIGDAQFCVTVPKDASKAVEVKRVE